jgi:predicted amidohydrolase
MPRRLPTCLFLLTACLSIGCGASDAGDPTSPPAPRQDKPSTPTHARAHTFRVAAVQAASQFGKPQANRTRLAEMIVKAARGGAKIVVLPEAAVTGYLTYDIKTTWRVGDRELGAGLTGADPQDAAETVPGPSTEFFGHLAQEHGLYVTVPLVEVDPTNGNYYNTSVLIGPDGKILLHYRKRNPWPWAERGWATDGDRGNPVADTPFGRLGLLICYDIHEQAAVMGRLKIDTLLYSIAWVEDAGSTWFARDLPAKAKECGFNIIAANWTIPGARVPRWHGYGQSRIIAAAGTILAAATDDLAEETVFAEIPLPPDR